MRHGGSPRGSSGRSDSADTLNDCSTDGGSSVGADDQGDSFQDRSGRHDSNALTDSVVSQPWSLDADDYNKNEPLKRWAEAELARVPESALLWLRRSLSGPWTSRDSQVLRVRIWTIAGSYQIALGGYLAYCFGRQLHTDSTYTMMLTYSAMPVWGVVAVLLGEASFSMGRALLDRDAPDPGAGGLSGGSDGKPLPAISENLLGGTISPRAGPRAHTNFNWMVELLQSNVSVDVLDEVNRRVSMARILAVLVRNCVRPGRNGPKRDLALA